MENSTLSKAPAGDQAPGARSPSPWLALLLLGLVLAAAWPALSAELVYDDLQVIRQNPRITSLANWPDAFSATYWEFLEPEVADRIGYWRPLATLTHTLVYVLADGATAAFHAASILVHLLAVGAAFRFARRLLGSTAGGFWAALLFGLHPINVESWAWASAINGVLAGLFSILALDAHLTWRSGGSRGTPWKTLVCGALALLSKETAVSIVPLVLAVDLARPGAGPLVDRLRPAARAYLPLAGLLGLYWGARVLVFGSLGAGLERVTTDFGPDVDAVRLIRLRVELLGGGLGLAAVPDPALFRAFRPVISAGDPTFLRDLAVLCGVVVALLVALWARSRTVASALAFALLALTPVVLRVESLGSFPLSDRFLYMTTLGVALLVAGSLTRLPAIAATPVLAVLAGGAGWMAHDRATTWQNEEALFRTAVVETPESPYVRWGLGRVLLERYQEHRDLDDLRDALECFETSADLLERALKGDSSIFATRQDAEQTNVGLGWCYLFEAEIEGSGDFSTARAVFEAALRGTPDSESAYTGLGVARHAQGQVREAREAYTKALQLNPLYVEAHHNLAQLHWQEREWPLAQHHVEKALELRPDHFENTILLARVQYERGHLVRAQATAERAAELDPSSPEPHEVLAVLAGARGDGATAMRHLDQALRLDPNYGRTHYLRANEFMRREDTAAAIASLRRAVDLMPLDFPAHHDLGALLLARGAVEPALPFLARAYELCVDQARLALMRSTLSSLAIDDPELLRRWARVDRGRRDNEWASLWLDRALALDPDSIATLYLRSSHRQAIGELESAAVDLRRVCELDPQAFQPLLDLGELLMRLERPGEAADYLQRAVELGPPEAWDDGLRKIARERAARSLADVLPGTGE